MPKTKYPKPSPNQDPEVDYLLKKRNHLDLFIGIAVIGGGVILGIGVVLAILGVFSAP